MEMSNEAAAKILCHWAEIRKVAGEIAAKAGENPYLVAIAVAKSLEDMEKANLKEASDKISKILGVKVEVKGDI